jgi:hypothetical protein
MGVSQFILSLIYKEKHLCVATNNLVKYNLNKGAGVAQAV